MVAHATQINKNKLVMKENKKTKQFNFKVNEEEAKAIQKLADDRYQGNVSFMIRDLIKKEIEKNIGS